MGESDPVGEDLGERVRPMVPVLGLPLPPLPAGVGARPRRTGEAGEASAQPGAVALDRVGVVAESGLVAGAQPVLAWGLVSQVLPLRR